MALSPFALSILGMEHRRRHGEVDEPAAPAETTPSMPARTSRRATSHFNAFQTLCSPSYDTSPAYDFATKSKNAPRRHADEGTEVLPEYTSSVSAEAKLLLQLESINPLHGVSESDWREVYVVLRGTLLSIYRVKDGGAGKLLRSYTLQHAEVGLAADSQHTVLIPQSRLAHLIPASARHKAWRRDPDLFKPVRQHIMRLRVETDQLLLADSSEERLHDLVNAISAGIDISFSIDERTIPRQCTVPRRRRRHRPEFDGNMNDPAVLAEQERILREMYPAFAEEARAAERPQLPRTTTEVTANTATPAREEDDLDFAVMREDFASPHTPAPTQTQERDATLRPAMSRHTTASSVTSTLSNDMIYATSPQNFTTSGKWQPPHPRTSAQIQRYTRRCMPVLLAESVRASDVLICHGRRVKINWRMELLEEWALNPPSYRSHKFDAKKTEPSETGEITLRRTTSVSSQTPSTPQSSRSALGDRVDPIEPIDTSLANLELAKVPTNIDQKSPTRAVAESQESEIKTQETRHPGTEVHGVVFCF